VASGANSYATKTSARLPSESGQSLREVAEILGVSKTQAADDVRNRTIDVVAASAGERGRSLIKGLPRLFFPDFERAANLL
jgi:hypothetical protein